MLVSRRVWQRMHRAGFPGTSTPRRAGQSARQYRSLNYSQGATIFSRSHRKDPSYSFHACVKESLAKNALCRLPWDEYSSESRSVCSSIQEFELFARSYEFLKDTSKRPFLQLPCLCQGTSGKECIVQASLGRVQLGEQTSLLDNTGV